MDSGAHELELVDRAVSGDEVALKLLLTEGYERLCQRLARRLPANLRSLFDVEDAVQTAHVEVFRRITTFVAQGPGSFERWMTAIALNQLRNAIRRHRTVRRGGGQQARNKTARTLEDSSIALLELLAAPGRSPSRSAARRETATAVQAAVKELPEQYREAVWLVHIEGRSVGEAAEAMQRTERAVHGLCRRGRELLRARLESGTNLLSLSG